MCVRGVEIPVERESEDPDEGDEGAGEVEEDIGAGDAAEDEMDEERGYDDVGSVGEEMVDTGREMHLPGTKRADRLIKKRRP